MKIAVLLPYKENYSSIDTGAVSIFVNDVNNLSKFKKNITIYGSTTYEALSKNYKNLSFEKKLLQSSSKIYVKEFLNSIKKDKFDLLEIHNRPHYLKYLSKLKETKKIIFFHNNPLEMQGSTTVNDRNYLLKNSDALIFNSNWTKNKFLYNLDLKNHDKINVIPQSTSKVKVDFSKKKKIISFVGKLNSAKGFDIFGESILNILNKYDDWSGIIIGSEPRQKLFYEHSNLKITGFKNNNYVLNKLKEVSISVTPSRWNEPFGRSSLEAASRGCAIIRSDTGGLRETTNHSIVLKKLSSYELTKKIEFLIKNPKNLRKLQKLNYKNFVLTNKYSCSLLDNLREKLFSTKSELVKSNKIIKILHITNFNERFNARLHYNTGKRINNGLIRLGYNVYQLSDRDIISTNRSLLDFNSEKFLNNKVIEICKNFKPDFILLGHADLINSETLNYLKTNNKNLRIAQWFLDPLSKFGPDYLNNKKRILKNIDFIDSTFITTEPSVLDFKINNCYFIPNPVDKSFETLQNFKYTGTKDLFFAMSHGVHRGNLKKGKSDDRKYLLNKLSSKKGIICDFYGINKTQPIWAEDFLIRIAQSNMGLNLSRGKPIKYYSSDRIAQLMGNGLLTFIHKDYHYSDFFTDKEIVTYKNYNDLVKKILYFKKKPALRKLIAKNGYEKYHKEFGSEKVAKFIISKITNLYSREKFYWVR